MNPAPPILILLATYNGARHLQVQLDSLRDQSHANWRLIVSDDGSTDGTPDLCDAFTASMEADRVTLAQGPRQGATANFLHLLSLATPGHPVAFCDQDDRWFPDKLARAADALAGVQGAAHYSARTMICDAALTPLAESPRFARPFGFRNALVQACTAGNTSVFNAAAADLLRAAAPAAARAGIVSHDWWAYQVVSGAGGAILKDDRPVLDYRQHGGNEMGRNDTLRARLRRLSMLFEGQYGAWLAANHAALSEIEPLLTPENRQILHRFGTALRQPGPRAAHTLATIPVYRHDSAGTAALYAAAAASRLRI